MHYNINDFELVSFFTYTSTIPFNECIVDVHIDDKKYPNIANEFNNFYNAIVERARFVCQYMKHPVMFAYFDGNKAVYKIRRKKDGKLFYIGRYDWNFSLGNGVIVYEGSIFDFTTMTMNQEIPDNYKEKVNEC